VKRKTGGYKAKVTNVSLNNRAFIDVNLNNDYNNNYAAKHQYFEGFNIFNVNTRNLSHYFTRFLRY